MERSRAKKIVIAAGLILCLAGAAPWSLADGQGPALDPETGEKAALEGNVSSGEGDQGTAQDPVRIGGQSTPPEDWDGTEYHVVTKKDIRPVHQNVWPHPRSQNNHQGRVVKGE